jgi:hypothetical protein
LSLAKKGAFIGWLWGRPADIFLGYEDQESEMTKAQQTREPRYRVFKGKGSRTPAFTTNWKFLSDAYVRYRCQNYGRIEKLVSGQYKTILEMAYGIRYSNN